jgi:hypothetical protein
VQLLPWPRAAFCALPGLLAPYLLVMRSFGTMTSVFTLPESEERMASRETPKFTGVRSYRDDKGRYTFRHPTDWHQHELDQERDGVMFAPQAHDPQTYFAVWLTNLGQSVVAEDKDELLEGVQEGLAQLGQLEVLKQSDDLLGNLIKFERIYTFRDDEVTRKRKVWIMYVDKWLYVVMFQGETVEEYQYWIAMANYSFNTFDLPEALWFAVDRDLNPHGIVS